MPEAISKVLDDIGPVMELAAEFAEKQSVLFIGRHVGYPVALEGSRLKGWPAHPCRRLRGRRTQARSDRIDRKSAASVCRGPAAR